VISKEPNHLRILSLGAGVQSSTVALMIEKGEIPMVDLAIFADTMGEPERVYEWLDWLEGKLSYPVHKVSFGDLRAKIMEAAKGNIRAFTAPFYTLNPETGKKSILRRQCTNHYKIQPIVKEVRKLLGLKKGEKRKKGTHVEMIMGISTDEASRMKTNRIKYITNVYPLIDKRMNRQDCKDWMLKYDYPVPPRSSCTFCPFNSNQMWQSIKNNKEEWEKVVEMDLAIRSQTTNSRLIEYELYLHHDCKPISEIDFNKRGDERQLDLFNNECEGMCGV